MAAHNSRSSLKGGNKDQFKVELRNKYNSEGFRKEVYSCSCTPELIIVVTVFLNC